MQANVLIESKTEFVFVKTTLGTRPSGRYGLYDTNIIILSDHQILKNPEEITYIGGDKLSEVMGAATLNGLHYQVWRRERDVWLATAFRSGGWAKGVIEHFDNKWSAVAETFVCSNSSIKRQVKPIVAYGENTNPFPSLAETIRHLVVNQVRSCI